MKPHPASTSAQHAPAAPADAPSPAERLTEGRPASDPAIVGSEEQEKLRRAEQELVAANQRWQALMQALPVGVSFSDDSTCRRIIGNPAVLAQFEVTTADNLSASAPDASAPGRQVRFFRDGQPITDADLPLQRAVAENREIPPLELEVLLPSGRRWFALASAAPIRDPQGKVVGGVAVTRDISERKHAEQALASQREELQLILDSCPAMIFYKDRENHFLRVNRAFAESMGMPKEQLEGKSLFDIYPREQAEAYWRDDQEVLASGRPKTNIVEPMPTPLGERWVETGKVPCRDRQGNPTGVIGFALDITERKRAEAALRQSEEMLRAVTDNSPDAIYVKDRESRWLMANPAVLRIVGKTAQEALGKTDLELYADPAIGRAILENDRRILERGEAEAFEEVADTPDGRRTFVSIKAPRRDPQGQIIGLIGISRDITERKQAEAALRESEARAKVAEAVGVERRRLQEVLNLLPAYVILLSPDYRVPFANRFFEERFGKAEGRRCYEYLFHRTEPCENCETYKVLQTKAPHRWEWNGPDGRNYDIHDFPFTDVDGSPLIMEVGVDITERRKAEAELVKHREHLRELVDGRTAEVRAANEELTRFNRAMVGRELRMVELKQEVNELCGKLGQPPRYSLPPES